MRNLIENYVLISLNGNAKAAIRADRVRGNFVPKTKLSESTPFDERIFFQEMSGCAIIDFAKTKTKIPSPPLDVRQISEIIFPRSSFIGSMSV